MSDWDGSKPRGSDRDAVSTTSANCQPRPPPKFTVCVGKSGVSVTGGETAPPGLKSPECRVQFACSAVAASACCALRASAAERTRVRNRPATCDGGERSARAQPRLLSARLSWAQSSRDVASANCMSPWPVDALWRRPATSVVSLHDLPGLCGPSGIVPTTGHAPSPMITGDTALMPRAGTSNSALRRARRSSSAASARAATQQALTITVTTLSQRTAIKMRITTASRALLEGSAWVRRTRPAPNTANQDRDRLGRNSRP